MNILLIEGNEQQRLMIEKIAKLHGENLFSARDCQSAIEFLGKNSIDLALIDLDSESQKRIEFVRAMREADPEKNTYIIVGTDKGDTSDILDVLEAGASEFLSKPYERSVLEAKILLGKRKGFAGDAIGLLTEEHQAILRAVRVLEYISDKMLEKEIPKTLLEWATSTSFLLDSEVHHKKEEHLIISFLEQGSKAKSQNLDPSIFSRSSLKTVEVEHVDLVSLKKDIQVNIGRYSQMATEERMEELRNSILDYSHLLRDHMLREERFLFPTFRPLLSEDENARLLREFQDVETSVGIAKIDDRTKLLLAAEELVQKNLNKRVKAE